MKKDYFFIGISYFKFESKVKNLNLISFMNVKTSLAVLASMISYTFIFAQSTVTENPQREEGLNEIFDNRGNKFDLKDLRITSKYKNFTHIPASMANSQYDVNYPTCNSGYFDLYFEDGSGCEIENDALHIARRDVLCQVFSDISSFINSPISSNGLGTKVNIWVRNLSLVEPTAISMGVAGAASALNIAPPNTTPGFGGIIDNEIWKTINSGVDSYTSVAPPLAGIANTGSGNYFHGILMFNFSTINWNLNLTSSSYNTNQRDLYSVVLHEVMHALGISSMLNYNGSPLLGDAYKYYSRYDMFLKDNSQLDNLISNPGACSVMYDYQFNPTLLPVSDYLTPGCTITPDPIAQSFSDETNCDDANYFVGSVTLPIYTPSCYERGSSFSHFEDECYPPNINNGYFVMSNSSGADINIAGAAGFPGRYLTTEEKQVLCDLGYSLNSTFGNSFNYNFKNYGNGCAPENVVGINDGIDPLNGDYIYQVNSNDVLTIDGILGGLGFLDNDFNTASYECMQDVYDPSALITELSPSAFSFQASVIGLHLLRYVPVSASGVRGNITYLYVYVISGNCVPSACNMINNGDFEESTSQCGQLDNPSYPDLPMINCWIPYSQTPDLFKRNCAVNTIFTIPDVNPQWGVIGETWDANVNNTAFLGLWGRYSHGPVNNAYYANESAQTQLNSPIIGQGQVDYRLSFRARMAYSEGALPKISIFGSDGFLPYDANPISLNPLNLLATVDLTQPDDWNYYEVVFQNSGTDDFNNLILMNTSLPGETGTYIVIDDVVLTPVNEAAFFDLPTALCNGQLIENLADYITQGTNTGVFSGAGVTEQSGIYSFDPQLAGPGLHEITYTYSNNIGCPFSISDLISVSGNVPDIQVISASLTEVCAGELVSLSLSNSSNCIWQPGNLSGSQIDVNPTTTTTYTAVGEDLNGCGDLTPQTITILVNALPTIEASVNPTVICPGQNADLTASGAVSYDWNNSLGAGSDHAVNPSTTTTYEVTGTGANGCSNTAQVTLNVVQDVSITAVNETICAGQSVDLTAANSDTYMWDNGLGTSATITVSPSVTTSYTVTGVSNGCTSTSTITITVQSQPVISISSSATAICEGESLDLTASGASTYDWNNGLGAGELQTVSPLITTSYEVTGTDENGCTNTASINVVVNPLPVLNVTASSMSICEGQTSTISASGALTYSWDQALGLGQSHNVSPSSTTTYTVTGTDANTCSNTAQIEVAVIQSITLEATSLTLCQGQSTILTASGGNSFVWDNNLGSGTTHQVSPSTTTTYQVSGINNGCNSTAAITITVNPLPNVTLTASDESVCYGESTTLNAGGALTYSWNWGLGVGESHTITPTAIVTYVVTGTDANTCTNTAQIEVYVAPLVFITATDNVICAGESTSFTAYMGSTYTWDNGLSNGAYHQVSPATTTTYTVTGTLLGCQSTASVTITVNPIPTINLSATPESICSGGSTNLTANGALSYIWDNGLGSGSSHTASPNATTVYTVVGTDVNNCENTAELTVNVSSEVSLSATSLTICEGESTTLTANGSSAYTWDNGLPTGSSHIVSPTSTTTYTVNGNQSTCTNTASITITVIPDPIISISTGSNTFCSGTTVDFTATVVNDYINPIYEWKVNGIVVGSNAPTFSSSTLQDGDIISCTLTSDNSCSTNNVTTSQPITVSVLNTPELVITAPASSCPGQLITLSATGADSYSWNTGPISSTIIENFNNTTTYTVTGTNTNGCQQIQSVTVNAIALPIITVSATATTICEGQSVTLTVSGALQQGEYEWTANGFTMGTGQSKIISPPQTTTYNVIGTTYAGCSNTTSITITVNPKPVITLTPISVTICNGSDIELTVTSDQSTDTYVWRDLISNINIDFDNSAIVSPSSTNAYRITVTNSFGCSSQATSTVFVMASPNIVITPANPSICLGYNTTLMASGGLSGSSYTWKNISTGLNFDFDAQAFVAPTSTTDYELTVTNPNGCTAIFTTSVTVNLQPSVTVNPISTTICAGQSVDITATGTGNNITYVWNNLITHQNIDFDNSLTVSPTSVNAYQVLVMDENGCWTTAISTVYVNPTPNIVVSTATPTICSGLSATLIANGAISGSTYVWTNTTSGQDIDFDSQASVSPTETTEYKLTVTSPAGCTVIIYKTITVTIGNSITVSPANYTLCSGQSVQLSASGASNYIWSNNTSGTNISVSPIVSTTFTVSAYINGCLNMAEALVNVADCSCNDISATQIGQTGIINGNVTYGATPGKYFIANDVTLTNMVTFDNSEVLVAPNVTITVPSGARLTFKGAHVYACSGEMWEGIVVENGGILSILNSGNGANSKVSLIEDAITAAKVLNDISKLDAINSVFNKNLTAITLQNIAETTLPNYQVNIENNLFTCRDIPFVRGNWSASNLLMNQLRFPVSTLATTLLDDQYIKDNVFSSTNSNAYLKAPYNWQKSAFGIRCVNVGYTTNETMQNPSYKILTIGVTNQNSFNLFDNLSVGIYSSRANLKLINNKFQNTIIDNNSAVPLLMKGKGIYLFTGKAAKNKVTVDNSIFSNCHNAININNYYEVYLTNNTIKSTQLESLAVPNVDHQGKNGINVTTNQYRRIEITSNFIYNIENGVVFNSVFGAVYNVFGGVDLFQQYTGQVNIIDNLIQPEFIGYMTSANLNDRYVRNAIIANNVINASVPDLTNLSGSSVSITDNELYQVNKGIEVQNWYKGIIIEDNKMSLKESSMNGFEHVGITHSSNSIGSNLPNLIKDNEISGFGINNINTYGIKYNQSINSKINCNRISLTNSALCFSGSSLGSIAKRNTFNNHQYGFVLNGSGTAIGVQGGDLLSNRPADNEYVGFGFGTFKTAVMGGASSITNGMWVHNTPLYNPDLSSTSIWPSTLADEYAIGNGTIFTSLLPMGAIQNCPNVSMAPVNEPDLIAVERDYIHDYIAGNISFKVEPQKTNYIVEKQLVNMMLNDIELVQGDIKLEAYLSGMKKSNHALINEIEKNLALGNYTEAEVILSQVQPNEIDDNFTRFQRIYIRYSQGLFDENDRLKLFDLGNKCPLTNGKVVFQARALYGVIYGYDYLFRDNCLPNEKVINSNNSNGIASELNSVVNEIKVYPNPNNGKFYINSMNLKKVRVMDMQGREIQFEMQQINEHIFEVQLNASKGLYNIQVSDSVETKNVKIKVE